VSGDARRRRGGDARRRLDEAGRRPVAPPDAAFADALEARLHAVAEELPATPARPRRRRPAPGRWFAAAGVAAAAVLVAALALGLARPDRQPGPGMALEGVNVEVVLVNGTILEDPDGLLLPEGAVIRVREGGFAKIGETVLRPGDVATVGSGRVEVERPSPVGIVTEPSPTRPPRPPATPARASGPPSASPSATPTSSPAPARTSTPATPAEGTQPPTAAGATRAPTASAATATLQPTPTPTPAIVRPRLRAVLVETANGPRIAVRWTETWSAARYVLVATWSRSGPATDPVYPGSRVIGEFAAPPSRAFRVRVPDRVVEARLMVVALREDGRVLRRSRIATVAIPVAADPMGEATPTAPPAQGTPETPMPTPAPASPPAASPTPAP
jgi:hypothetical protein